MFSSSRERLFLQQGSDYSSSKTPKSSPGWRDWKLVSVCERSGLFVVHPYPNVEQFTQDEVLSGLGLYFTSTRLLKALHNFSIFQVLITHQ
jgi:hypothetical protein